MNPPPLAPVQKFLRFGSWILPLSCKELRTFTKDNVTFIRLLEQRRFGAQLAGKCRSGRKVTMSNDRDIEDRLGEIFVSKILDHADEGHFEDSDLMYIARKLGETSEGPNKMIGNHKRRMKDKPPHRIEMRNILSDFWNVKLYDLERGDGRDVLIQIFKSPDLTGDGHQDLAKKLEHLYLGEAQNRFVQILDP